MLKSVRILIKEGVLHPSFIAFILWLAVVFLMPRVFAEFRIVHVSDEFTNSGNNVYYDINSDGYSEKISLDLNDVRQTKIIFSNENKIIDQYNVRFQIYALNEISFGDYNSDGLYECYVFTSNDDSIFLNIIDPLGKRGFIVKKRFIDVRGHTSSSTDRPFIKPVEVCDIANRGKKDFIFFITAGFSKRPRSVYRYLISEDSLVKSPLSGACIYDCKIADLKDSGKVLIIDTQASANLENEYPFTDQYNWLMILKPDLKFLFPPVKTGASNSHLTSFLVSDGDKNNFASYLSYFGEEKINSGLSVFDLEGKKLKEFPDTIPVAWDSRVLNIKGSNSFYLVRDLRTTIEERNKNFLLVRKIDFPPISGSQPLACLDANRDGKNELIFMSADNRSLIFTGEDFSYNVLYTMTNQGAPFIYPLLLRNEKPSLYLQYKGKSSIIRFEKNPLYLLKIPFYLGLFLFIYTIVYWISRVQRYRFELKQKTEREIASLQMLAIKNQIDPHFTLNILNSIGSLYATEKNREKADYVFGKYARLIRETVISSDKVIITIEEELEFVRNYLDLEKFRCNDAFTYAIDVQEGFDMKLKIPRMLIHTFVENAVKYNLRIKNPGNLLRITLKVAEDNLIRIEDIRYGQSINSDLGTGKGIQIVNELIDLFYRLEKVKIFYSTENKTGHSGKIIWIHIPR